MTRPQHGKFVTPPDLCVADLAARQHGRVRIDQLAACGLSEDAVALRVRKGWLHRVHHGVYAVGHAGMTLDAALMAAVLAGGEGAFASHWAAATLHRFVRWDRRRVDVSVPGAGTRMRPGIRFRRPRRIDPKDLTRVRGIPTTTAARALLEIAPQLSDRRLRRAVRQAQAERSANVRQIADVLRRANGHAGTARLARIIATGPAPTVSGDEDVVLDLILGAGFEHPEVNGGVPVGAIRYRPDLRWPAQRVILEVDSRWHDGAIAQRDDAERQADLEAAGERVLRTTAASAILRPRQLLRRLEQAGAPYTACKR
ncbi:MAG: type IV toxin-antitoxin system AbiEi family antitoxin domain-containing protein [Solirubrobacteraceae bacterium]